MRLIDIDKISKDAEWDENYHGFISYSSAMIDEAEIIEAIPIWWIEQWLDRVTGARDGDDISKYHDLVKGGILFINMLERDWEKENE